MKRLFEILILVALGGSLAFAQKPRYPYSHGYFSSINDRLIYATAYSGSTVAAQVNAAVSANLGPCVIVITPEMSGTSGDFTGMSLPNSTYEIEDLRGGNTIWGFLSGGVITKSAQPWPAGIRFPDGTVQTTAATGGGGLPTASQPGQIITSTAAGTTYAVQGNIFYSQSSDTISSIESECSSACTYVVTGPQTFILSADHTLSTNVRVEFKAAGLWTVNGAFTLTIPSNVSGPPTQHFAGTSTIKIGVGTSKVYAEWWGAVGDGTTDDSTAIQAAITSLYGAGAAGSNDGHGAVQLLARTYSQGTTGMTITHGGVKLLGINESITGTLTLFGSAITTSSASVTQLSVLGTSGSYIIDNQVKDIAWKRTVQPTGTATGISLQYLYRTVVDHNFVVNSIRGFYIANIAAGGTGIIQHNNTSLSSVSGAGTYYGFYVDESGTNTTPSLKMNYNTSDKGTGSPTTTYGFYATGANIEDIHNRNYETAQLTYAVYLNGSSTTFYASSDNIFTDNIHDGCTTSCYYITGMKTAATSSVLISGGRVSTTGTSPGVDIESSNGVSVHGVSLAGVVGSGGLMIKVSGGSGNSIVGNVMSELGTSYTGILLNSTTSDVVASNVLTGNFSGITAVSLTSATNNIITGNSLSGTLATGMSFDATSGSNYAYPNMIHGTVTTPISDSGSGNETDKQDVITWPASGDLLLSTGTSSVPSGLAEVDGDCVVGSAGAWTAGSCSGVGGTLTVTDGTHTVGSVTNLSVTGGTVGGTTPNATLSITGGSGGAWTNITGSVTVTGCTVSGGACSVVTPGTSVDFSSIPGTYNHLKLIIRGRLSDSALAEAIVARFNADSGSNYDQQRIQNTTGSASSAQNGAVLGLLPAATASTNVAGSGEFLLPNYAGATFYKTLFGQSGYFETLGTTGTYFNNQVYNLWRNTAAVTEITIVDFNGGNFVAGSSFSLYGVQ